MKVYSKDLRERVLKAYNDKKGSMRKLADDFMVSLACFQTVKRFKHNGHINPKPPEEEGRRQWMQRAVNLWLKF